MLQVLEL